MAGARVEGKYKGEWHPAVVEKKVHGKNSYIVAWQGYYDAFQVLICHMWCM